MFWKKSVVVLSFMAICVFANPALSQTTQSAPATLTPEERESALKLFQTTHDNFLKSISGLSQKQWTFKPAPDRWSVAEAHHRFRDYDHGTDPTPSHAVSGCT